MEKAFDSTRLPEARPDYGNCIANLPNSVMRYFGVEPAGETLPLLDRHLKPGYRNIVVLLLDGLGVNILETHTKPDGFFRSHLAEVYRSTFPPTTVAATTSVLSGLMPCEHAWLGWDCYYPQIDKNVTVFRNLEQHTEKAAAPFDVAATFTPYESIIDRFEKAGKRAFVSSPFSDPFPQTLEAVLDRTASLCREQGETYVYTYWTEPDTVLHEKGCFSEEAGRMVRSLEDAAEKLSRELKDTLLIVTADHGHTNTKGALIQDYPSLADCLVRLPSIEPRALNLFVKEGKKDFFAAEFNRLFGDKFLLLTKEEVLEAKLFGTGKEHPLFREMLGDFLAIAVSDLSIFSDKDAIKHFVGVHAGLTEDEMRIPLILVET